MDIRKELLEIVRDYIDCDPDQIDTSAKFKLAVGIDSFIFLAMISAIEDSFSIRIPSEQIGKFETIDDLIAYLESVKNA